MAHFPTSCRLCFGLRALLLLTLVVGVGLAWVHRGRDQKRAIEQMLASNPGAALLYDYEVDAHGGLTQPGTPPGSDWLRQQIGIDHLSSIAGADMFYPTDADVAVLTRFPHLRRLHLERSVDLTDAGMASLAKFTSLKLLVLGEADQVTVAGLQQLASLKNLEVLRLDPGRRMTRAGIEQLQSMLPDCRIEIRDNPDEETFAAAH